MLIADQGRLAATDSRLNGKTLSIGMVQARFNAAVTDALAQACFDELLALGVPASQIKLVQVPGALEVPVALMGLAETLDYDALIALGCIIRGDTYHFELVANAILTTDNMEQAVARQTDKGRDAARVAVEMAHLMKAIA